MTPIWTPAERGARSLGTLLLAIALAGCAGEGTTAPSPTQIPSPTPAAVPASPAAVAGSPAVTPMPTVRTTWDIPPYEELVKLFAYDPTEPLGYTQTEADSTEQAEGSTVYDISYQSGGNTVPAKLVMPDGPGPFPAVLYAHGLTLGPGFFVPEMQEFARQGYAGLAILGPEHRAPFSRFVIFDADEEIASHVGYVTDLRRAIDALETLPTIHATRLGFAGHSLGCQMGSILSGVDDRIDAFVLMSCPGGYVSDPVWGWAPMKGVGTDEERARYRDRIAVLNAANYVSHNEGAAFLVQGDKDDYGPNIQALFDAAVEPKTLTWYEGGHGLGCETFGACDPALPAFADHRAWLKEHV